MISSGYFLNFYGNKKAFFKKHLRDGRALFISVVHAVFVKDLLRVAGARAVGWKPRVRAGVPPASLDRAPRTGPGEPLFCLFWPLLKMPTCRSSPLPTPKEPRAPGESWVPWAPATTGMSLSATDGGPSALLRGAGIIPLRAETLLFHSSKRCQSKSQEGLFLALFSIVT